MQISPRVGFVWDVFKDNSLKVRGGTGIFTGRLPLVILYEYADKLEYGTKCRSIRYKI